MRNWRKQKSAALYPPPEGRGFTATFDNVSNVKFHEQEQCLEIGAHKIWPVNYLDLDLGRISPEENGYLQEGPGFAVAEMEVYGQAPTDPEFCQHEIIDFAHDHIYALEKVLEKEMKLENKNIAEHMSLFEGQDPEDDFGLTMG